MPKLLIYSQVRPPRASTTGRFTSYHGSLLTFLDQTLHRGKETVGDDASTPILVVSKAWFPVHAAPYEGSIAVAAMTTATSAFTGVITVHVFLVRRDREGIRTLTLATRYPDPSLPLDYPILAVRRRCPELHATTIGEGNGNPPVTPVSHVAVPAMRVLALWSIPQRHDPP